MKFESPFCSKQLENLPSNIRAEIQKISGVRPGPFFFQLILAWTVIFASIGIASHLNTVWAQILAIIIIGTRINILGLLIHEQAHKLGMRGQLGDSLVNLLAAYPLIIMSVENYAKVHIAHHKHYFSEKDPEHLRKTGIEWQIPKKSGELLKLFLMDAIGLSFVSIIRGKNNFLEGAPEFLRAKPTPKWIRPLFLLTMITVLSGLHLWIYFLLYWVVPILTIAPVIIRWGALSEHIYNTPGARIEENSPLIIPSRLDRILLPNLNFSFHPYHHWYSNVSFSELPKVHALYRQQGLVDESKTFSGNLAFLRFILSAQNLNQHNSSDKKAS